MSVKSWLRRPTTLTGQLVAWFLLIGLVPLALLTVAAYLNSTSILRRDAASKLVAIAERQSHGIETYIRERERSVAVLAVAPSIGEALNGYSGSAPGTPEYARLDALFRPFLTHFRETAGWEDVFLVSPAGDVVFTAGNGSELGTNLRTGPYRASELGKTFERAVLLMGTDVSDFAYSAAGEKPAAFMASPVISGGKLAGVAVFEMSNAEVFNVVNDYTGLGRTGETLIASRAGGEALFLTPVRHDPGAAFHRRVPLEKMDGSDLKDVVRGRIRSGSTVDYRGKKVLAVSSYLPYLRWMMVVKIDADEAFQPVARLRLLSSAIEVPLFLGVVLAALFVGRGISRPVVRLTRVTRAVAGGDLTQRAAVEAGNELGVLAAAFNDMAGKLQQSIAEMDTYSKDLELRVIARTQEITEKNQALEKTLKRLKKAQEQILLQEKMASLGSLTAGIAHEIKNPLNFVTNFAFLTGDLLKEIREGLDTQKDRMDAAAYDDLAALLSDVEQNAAKILEHGRRADSIVKSMLLHSRGKAGERQLTDLNALVQESVNLAYHAMRGQDTSFNIKIDADYDPDMGSGEVIPQDLSRVILNIVNNACYAAHQKKLKLGAAYSPVLKITTRNTGEWFEIRIRDNGPGIPKDVLEKVWNPFFTTKPAGAGTGLGLSISYDIVTGAHEGVLSVESEEGEFTEFLIALPRTLGQSTTSRFSRTSV